MPRSISTLESAATAPCFKSKISCVEARDLANATASPFSVKIAVSVPFSIPESTESTPGAVRLAPWQRASTAESRTIIFGSWVRAVSMGSMNLQRRVWSFLVSYSP